MPFGGEFGDYAMRRALRHIVDIHKKMKGDGIVKKTFGAAADYAEGQLGQSEASLQSAIPQSSAAATGTQAATAATGQGTQTTGGMGGMGDEEELIAGIPKWKFGKGATLLGGW